MEDEIIEVNETSYSLRKILKEDGWEKYCKASEKVKSLVKLKVRFDLVAMEVAMEIGFAKLDKMFNNSLRGREDGNLLYKK